MEKDTKNIVASVVISLLVCVVAVFAIVAQVKEELKASVPQAVESEEFGGTGGSFAVLTRGTGSLPGGLELGDAQVNFQKRLAINAGENQVAWRNTTGRSVVVDYAEMRTTGTASSSYLFYVGTSTAASNTSFDFGTAMFSELIDAPSLATSSPIKVFTSVSDTDQGTNGRGAIEVGDGEYVLFMFRKQDLINSCSGSVCEAATSTNRGFNVHALLKGHYIP